jgi:type IV pilus assembly protein PilA
MSPAKTAVSEFFFSQNAMPADEASAGFEPNIDSQYVNSVVLAATTATTATLRASIKDLGGTTAANQEVELLGTGGTSIMDWDCRPSGGTPIPTKYLPADCRT